MSEIRNLTRNGETFYPLTHVDAIVSNTGSGIDDVPTPESNNLVRSGGVFNNYVDKKDIRFLNGASNLVDLLVHDIALYADGPNGKPRIRTLTGYNVHCLIIKVLNVEHISVKSNVTPTYYGYFSAYPEIDDYTYGIRRDDGREAIDCPSDAKYLVVQFNSLPTYIYCEQDFCSTATLNSSITTAAENYLNRQDYSKFLFGKVNLVDELVENIATDGNDTYCRLVTFNGIYCLIVKALNLSFLRIISDISPVYYAYFSGYPELNDYTYGIKRVGTYGVGISDDYPLNTKYVVIQFNTLPNYIYCIQDLSIYNDIVSKGILDAQANHNNYVSQLIPNVAIYSNNNNVYLDNANAQGVRCLIFAYLKGEVIIESDRTPSYIAFFSKYPFVGDNTAGISRIDGRIGKFDDIDPQTEFIVIQYNYDVVPTVLNIYQDNASVTEKEFEEKKVGNLIEGNPENIDADFDIRDKNGYAIITLKDGHIITKNFDSEKLKVSNTNLSPENLDSDFDVRDPNGYSIISIKNGRIRTKTFDSDNVNVNADFKPMLLHIMVIGQSLANGTNANYLDDVDSNRALMFARVKTFDMGYNFGAWIDDYNLDQQTYDAMLYSELKPLKEQFITSYPLEKWWDDAANARKETPSAGIVEGILNMFKSHGFNDLPFYTLSTCTAIGGKHIDSFMGDTDVYYRVSADISHAMGFASVMNLSYKPIFVYIQGENDMSTGTPKSEFKTKFTALFNAYKSLLQSLGVDDNIKIYTYQPCGYGYGGGGNSTAGAPQALMELNNENTWFKMCYPIYNLPHVDHAHLSGLGSRALGNGIGVAIFEDLFGEFETIRIIRADLDSATNTINLIFNKPFVIDEDNYLSGNNGQFMPQGNLEYVAQYYGFTAADANGNNVITSITKINDTCLQIVCSATPVKLVYGYDNTVKERTIGGYIREKAVKKGYKNQNNLYLYMPAQVFDSFTTKHIYTDYIHH